MPYTPQQNIVVEQKHRYLLEIARALQFQASLSVLFWGDCVFAIAFIMNKLSSRVIENKTPHQIYLAKCPHTTIFVFLDALHMHMIANVRISLARNEDLVFL